MRQKRKGSPMGVCQGFSTPSALTGLRKAVILLGYVLLQSKDTDQNQQREKAQGGSPGETRYKLLGVLPRGVLWGQT